MVLVWARIGLIIINATYGPSRFSLDYYIERAFPGWARLAEFGTSIRGRTVPKAAVPA